MHLCEERPDDDPSPQSTFTCLKISGVRTKEIFPKYVTYKFLTAIRLNFLAKDSNPNYKNGKSEWRKNNTLGKVYFQFSIRDSRTVPLLVIQPGQSGPGNSNY